MHTNPGNVITTFIFPDIFVILVSKLGILSHIFAVYRTTTTTIE